MISYNYGDMARSFYPKTLNFWTTSESCASGEDSIELWVFAVEMNCRLMRDWRSVSGNLLRIDGDASVQDAFIYLFLKNGPKIEQCVRLFTYTPIRGPYSFSYITESIESGL